MWNCFNLNFMALIKVGYILFELETKRHSALCGNFLFSLI